MRPIMRNKQNRVAAIALLAITGVCFWGHGQSELPQTYYVDASYDGRETGSSNRPFNTIGEALAQTVAGRFDQIIVRRGTYKGPIEVTVTTTLLSEDGAAHTLIQPAANAAAPSVTLANGAAIRGFTFENTSGTGLFVAAEAAASVSNCIFYKNKTALKAGGGAQLQCFNNTFYQNTQALRVEPAGTINPLRNCVLADNGLGVSVGDGGSVASGYCAFFKNTLAYDGPYVPGDTDFVSNPQFVDPDRNNFHLSQTSNLRNTGDPSPQYQDVDGTQNDVGADGGPYGVMDMLAPGISVDTTPAPPQGVPPLACFLDASASQDDWGVASWDWDFNALDGVDYADGSGATVPVLFTEPGGYLISLRVTDNAGLSAVSMFNIRVGAPPQVLRMTPQPGAGPAPLTVAFTLEAVSLSGGALVYGWEFNGDSVIDSTEQNPVFTYPEDTAPGLKRAALLVMDEDQVSTQFISNITLTAYPVTASVEVKPGEGGQISITDAADALAGTRLLIPADALSEKVTFALSKVPEGAIPIMPEGNLVRMFDVAPANLLLCHPITVETPVANDTQASEFKIWYWQAGSQVWFDGGFSHIRVEEGLLSFDASHLGTFAITGPTTGGPCFIATAAYGTSLASSVQVLREDRDRLLLSNPLGIAFTEVYYRVSPPISDLVAAHPMLAAFVRLLLWPVVLISRMPWLGAALPAGALAVFGARRTIRRRRSE